MRGFIYRLIFPDNKFYIGSTIQTLQDRLAQHKYDFKRGTLKSKLHKYVLKESWNDVNIELLEEVDITTEYDIRFIEGEYIRLFRADEDCLNDYGVCLTDKEKRLQTQLNNQMYYRMYPEKYYEANKKKNNS